MKTVMLSICDPHIDVCYFVNNSFRIYHVNNVPLGQSYTDNPKSYPHLNLANHNLPIPEIKFNIGGFCFHKPTAEEIVRKWNNEELYD